VTTAAVTTTAAVSSGRALAADVPAAHSPAPLVQPTPGAAAGAASSAEAIARAALRRELRERAWRWRRLRR
jgi:hypothetical protein